MTSRAAKNLILLDAETERFLATCQELSAADSGPESTSCSGGQEPTFLDSSRDLARLQTLCKGWNLAHVLTHVARNADSLSNLVLWATDGVERRAYISDEQRDLDIETGVQRRLPEIVVDVEATATRFRELAEALTGSAGGAEVRTRTNTPVKGYQLIAMRTVEVVFHHVDLQAGYTFDDADPAWLARTLRRGASQWEAQGNAPQLTLNPTGPSGEHMPSFSIAGGGTDVSGTPGQLLLWLARGRADGLTSAVDVPSPPAWA